MSGLAFELRRSEPRAHAPVRCSASCLPHLPYCLALPPAALASRLPVLPSPLSLYTLNISGIYTSLLSHCCLIQYKSPNLGHCHLSPWLSQPPSSLSPTLTFASPPVPALHVHRRLFSKWLCDHITPLLKTFQQNPVAFRIKSDIRDMAFHNLTFLSDLILNLSPHSQLSAQPFSSHHTLLLQASYLSPLSTSIFIIVLFVRSAFTIGK